MYYLGIDPGQSGGLALLTESGSIVFVSKIPETEHDTADLLRAYASSIRMGFIERVNAMPKQGVVSTFKFGKSYGFLRGLLVALNIPFDEVGPASWQKAMSCLSKGNKNITKARAQRLFPSVQITHAIADALLIAEHCRLSRKPW